MQKDNRKYYEAYDDRYKAAHESGVSWEYMQSTPIVMEAINRYELDSNSQLLEIGCGEGRDSIAVLENGYNLMATDISPEAIRYCKETIPDYADHFSVMNCLNTVLDQQFDLIYAIAVIHMLVVDQDRDEFYNFIYKHLKNDGIALICTMGDGEYEMQSDISNAFDIQERNHQSGKLMVASTSCRMVSFNTFEGELERNKLEIIEEGITSSMPNFNSLMYVVVKRKS